MQKEIFFRILLVVLIINCIAIVNATGQSKNRISFQVTPLYSYSDIEPVSYIIDGLSGAYDPKLGFGVSLKFERDLNEMLAISTGLFYEHRSNSYTEIYYDTTFFILFGEPTPYKYFYSRSFNFVGIPVGVSLKYFNNSKIRLYQTFNFHFSYLLNAVTEGIMYYESGESEDFEYNIEDYRTKFTYSFSSTLGISKKISDKLSIKIEPGVIYMINNCLESYSIKDKFIDLKLDVGFEYSF